MSHSECPGIRASASLEQILERGLFRTLWMEVRLLDDAVSTAAAI